MAHQNKSKLAIAKETPNETVAHLFVNSSADPDKTRSKYKSYEDTLFIGKRSKQGSFGDAGQPFGQEIGDDDYVSYNGVLCLAPPVNFENLVELLAQSGILGQCVRGYNDGVFGKGYRLTLAEWLTREQKETFKEAIIAEGKFLKDFLENIDMEGFSHLSFRKRTGINYTLTGNGYWEVMRKIQTTPEGIPMVDIYGKPVFEEAIEGLHLLESINIRIVSQSKDWLPYTKYTIQDNEIKKRASLKRFKIFVQVDDPTRNPVEPTKQFVYFKEFGDPRRVDRDTGRIISEKEWQRFTTTQKKNFKPANEVIHFRQYFPGTPYGVPEYIGTIQNIVGSILKSTNDLKWFENGCKADLIITCEAPVSQESVYNVERYVKESSTIENARKALLLVPKMGFKLDSDKTSSKFTITEINQNKDASWVQYDQGNREVIKQSFRLSDLHIGANKDFNRATSEVAQEITEDNVFKPARDEFDYIFNHIILPRMGIKYYTYVSIPSTKDSKATLADAIYKLQYTGLTVREVRKLVALVFDIDLEGLETKLGKDDTYWLDYPILLAKEMFQQQMIPDDEIPSGPENEEPSDITVTASKPVEPHQTKRPYKRRKKIETQVI